VSRHHAVVELHNGVCRIRDLGSQNGTWLGDARITDGTLTNGMTIRVGDAVLTYHA
jgi:pSer/pThr/pTyr-binding forkhead associated (FHA) protein